MKNYATKSKIIIIIIIIIIKKASLQIKMTGIRLNFERDYHRVIRLIAGVIDSSDELEAQCYIST